MHINKFFYAKLKISYDITQTASNVVCTEACLHPLPAKTLTAGYTARVYMRRERQRDQTM